MALGLGMLPGSLELPSVLPWWNRALMTILTSHLKDIISHSPGSDAYSTTQEELAGQ